MQNPVPYEQSSTVQYRASDLPWYEQGGGLPNLVMKAGGRYEYEFELGVSPPSGVP